MSSLFHVVHRLDIGVYVFLNGFTGNWLIDHFASFEENSNLFKGGLFLSLYVYFWFRVGPRQKQQQTDILAILTGALLALVVSRTIANLTPYRLRPMYDPDLPHHASSFLVSLNLEAWSSFPSDTAAYFSALAFGLARLFRPCTLPIMLFTSAWICLPRLFFGAHYVSDIAVGVAIGVVIAQASLKFEWLRQKLAGSVLRLMDAKPHIFYAVAFLVLFEMGVLFDDVRFAVRGLFHAINAGHAHEFIRAIVAGFQLIGAFLIAAFIAFSIIRPRSSIFSAGFPRVRVTWHRAGPSRPPYRSRLG